jgi:hypothetical protein
MDVVAMGFGGVDKNADFSDPMQFTQRQATVDFYEPPEAKEKDAQQPIISHPSEPETPPIEGESAPVVDVPPSDQEAEEATLGSVLIDPACFSELTTILKPSDFYIRRHGWIWEAFENLTQLGDPLDFITIPSELTRMGQLEEIGGPAYLTTLLNQCPSSLHAVTYASKVKGCANKRGLLVAANEMAVMAYDPHVTAEQASARALEAIQENSVSHTRRYIVHDAADALAPRPPVKWIVEGRIYEKSITVMYGDGGTKKTWAGMYLAACVSSGAAWGDIETHKTRVLFVDEENGESEISSRAAYCIRGALADENADLKYISLAAFHLDDPKDEAILTAEILAQGAGLVILDALADLMIGDENSKQETQPVFNALRRITEKTGAAILIIHHSNKQGSHRGSSVIKDAPDILVQVRSEPDSHLVEFRTEKNRKGKAIKWAMYATWTEDRFYLSAADVQEKIKTFSKSQEYVIRYLTEHGASPLNEIEGAPDMCSSEAARKAVYSLRSLGMIRRTNPSNSGRIMSIWDLEKDPESKDI